MSDQQPMTEQQQIEAIATQAIANADSVSKIYTSQNQAIATLINEYASDMPTAVELPALDITSYRDLLPSSQDKLRPPNVNFP